MSTISSGTTLTTALVQTGDTTGNLVIKTGSSNTTAMTISGTDQGVTFAGAVNVASSAFANGSASAPSITFTGDINTGIFSPGADSIGFAEGGAEIARFDSSGNLGIGTNSPSARLDIRRSTTDGLIAEFHQSSGYGVDIGSSETVATISSGYLQALTFRTDPSSGQTERMRIDSSGNVGIGTSSPGSRLTLDGTLQIGAAGTASDVGITKIATRNIRFDSAPSAGTGITVNIGTDANQNSTFVVNGNALFNSGYGSAAIAYGCRAWVNFNGTGTVAIRASGNVSSVSDDGTGTYTINFTNAMPDANYNVVSNGPPNSTSVVGGLGFVVRNSSPSGSPSNKTTTQVQMMYAGTGSLVDASELYASVFR
jgi:hypothetical protein